MELNFKQSLPYLGGFLGAVVLATAAFVGGYWYRGQMGFSNVQTRGELGKEVSTTENGAVPKKTPSEVGITVFQKTLQQQCELIPMGAGGYYVIDKEKLPISIDEDIVDINDINYRAPGRFICVGNWENGKGYVEVEYGEDKRMRIYDDFSMEYGHEPPSDLGLFGEIIEEQNSLKLSTFLGYKSRNPGIRDGIIWVRGEETLKTNENETIHVNTTKAIVEGDNPRLVAFLSRYENEDGKLNFSELVGVDKSVATHFFSDLSNLQSPEKENLTQLEKVLAAVSIE